MNNVREEYLLGSRKLIVGNPNEELILESLGKIYLKYGRSTTVLNDVIEKINTLTSGDSSNTNSEDLKVQIVNTIDEIDSSLPNGALIFELSSSSLYIKINGACELLVEAKVNNADRFVLKKGDTMTGLLTITVEGLPPLVVTSNEVVQNLNADLLDNEHASAFARRELDEKITGNWTFKGKTTFDEKAVFNNNIRQPAGGFYTNGYMGTPIFTSGFSGTGWALVPSNSGYTLTVDNLVVRKAMLVYEMIVNKINATNGSMWVSDYAKVYKASRVSIVTDNDPVTVNTEWFVKYTPEEKNKSYYEVEIDPIHISTALEEGRVKEWEYSEETGARTCTGFKPAKYIIFSKLYHVMTITEDIGELLDKEVTEEGLGQEENILTRQEVEELDLFEHLEYFTGFINDLSDDSIHEDCIKAKFTIVPNQIYNAENQLIMNVLEVDGKYVYKKEAVVWSYYKYFSIQKDYLTSDKGDITSYVPNLYITEFDSDDAIPTLWEGDIIRCLKFYEHGIKYYDGLIGKAISKTNRNESRDNDEESKRYYLPVLLGIDNCISSTTVVYDEDSNVGTTTVEYKVDTDDEEEALELIPISESDLMVRIGSLTNSARQGALYLTSSETGSPYIDTLANVDRPDYSTIYYVPKYKTFKALSQVGTYRKYLDYYLQNDEFAIKFAALLNLGSGDLFDLYANYVNNLNTAPSTASEDSEQLVIEVGRTTTVNLTNSIVDTTLYNDKALPISVNYAMSPIPRKLYVDSEDTNYITIESFNDSTESVNGADGIVYYLGTV